MLTPMLGAVTASIALSASAGTHVSFSLVATVPVMCSVQSVTASPMTPDTLDVTANCNAEEFELVLGGDIAALGIAGVTSPTGQARALDGSVRARADRPGLQQFQLRLADAIEPGMTAAISISAL